MELANLEPERIRACAQALVRYPFRAWFYGDSIGFEGLLAASQSLNDDGYRAFAHGFVRAWAARREGYRQDDNTAPGQAMCLLYERTRDGLLLDEAVGLADWLGRRRRLNGVSLTYEDSPLSWPAGTAQLSPSEIRLRHNPGPAVYLDCLHFDPPFFTHLGVLIGDPELTARGVEEALGYVALLQDPESGLFHHFYLESQHRAYSLGWGRGQGWALLGLMDVLEHARPDTPGLGDVRTAARALAQAMASWQNDDGSWSAVTNESASGVESSTAAFMVAGLVRGVRIGVLDADTYAATIERAWASVLLKLNARGMLEGVSAAVYSSTNIEHYFAVSTGHLVPWGQGPVLAAALELSRVSGGAVWR